MFKSGSKQFSSLDDNVLDLSSGMPVVTNNHSSSRLHHASSIVRNSSPFNGSDNDMGGGNMGGSGGGMSGGGGDFDSDLLSGEDGQGISQVKWTREKIAKLLDLYGKFRVKIEDPKYRKTEIWNKIAKALSDYDGITVIGKQCWDKFRYMKARYLRAREQKRRIAAGLLNSSETSMITFPYFNELQELLGDTPFEQEISNMKRETPADTFDNGDEDFIGIDNQQDGKLENNNGDLNSYDDLGPGAFASPLLSNRRKRKFPSPTLTSDFDQNGGADLSSVLNINNNNNNNHHQQNGNHHSNGEMAVGNALSTFMTAVIEMETRKLELFKRFVDLYEKRTASGSQLSSSASAQLLAALPNALGLSNLSNHHSAAVGNLNNSSNHHSQAAMASSRFKRSAPSHANNMHHRSASSIGGKMSAPSSLGAALHSSSNNNS